MAPVSQRKIEIASLRLKNADMIAQTCREAGVPFAVACALFEKESGGRNIYGNDRGGTLSGYPYEVNLHNYRVFRWFVVTLGQVSNGVGPSQITWRGFFEQMEKSGLKPWDLHDNMLFGLQLLKRYRHETGSWRFAGRKYNGSLEYGIDLETRIDAWRARLKA